MSGPQTETATDNHGETYTIRSTICRQDSSTNTGTSDLEILRTLFLSGHLTPKEYAVYMRLRNRKLAAAAGGITFKSAWERRTSPAEAQVLNTPELLEMILLNLHPNHLLTSAQRVCGMFKRSMESSPCLRKRVAFATRDLVPIPTARWDVKPKCMSFHYVLFDHLAVFSRLTFKFVFAKEQFEWHRSRESFRKLCVSDSRSQRIEVLWHEGPSPDKVSNQMLWMLAKEGSPITFGQIFDAVAEQLPIGKEVGGLSLFLSKDTGLYGGPSLVGT